MLLPLMIKIHCCLKDLKFIVAKRPEIHCCLPDPKSILASQWNTAISVFTLLIVSAVASAVKSNMMCFPVICRVKSIKLHQLFEKSAIFVIMLFVKSAVTSAVLSAITAVICFQTICCVSCLDSCCVSCIINYFNWLNLPYPVVSAVISAVASAVLSTI